MMQGMLQTDLSYRFLVGLEVRSPQKAQPTSPSLLAAPSMVMEKSPLLSYLE